MTQSGQGEEPSAQPAREGIVLPSDGGEPLLPGMTGTPGGHPPAQPAGQAPAGGQAWGRPWGPDQQQAPSPQGWQTSAEQPWGAADPYQQQTAGQWGAPGQGAARHGAGALPPEGAPGTHHGAAQPPYDQQTGQAGAMPQAGADPYGYSAGQPAPHAQAGQPAPHAQAGHGAPHGQAGHGAPHGQGAYGGAPLPPADEGATQYLPPAAAAPAHEGATQYLPPVAAAPADEGATQYIPPVPGGALPPEAGDQATRYLGRVPQSGSGPLPGAATGGNPDAEATQYIPPVDAQGGGPSYGGTPAEFDNLFRDGSRGEAPGASTQQLPRFEQQAPHAAPAPSGPGGGPSYGGRGDGGGRGRRSGSRVPLIAAVGAGIVVLGVGAGALLSDGGDDKGADGKNQTVSATAPATPGGSAPASADPARQQAAGLDKLLADSGSSRASVIQAVADVKACKNLGDAAADLRDAARQRGELVARLAQLPTDKLPDHTALTSALTSAWKASQSADNHYAAWADQVGGKRGCKKGQARVTGEAQAGNRASGVASAQKTKAAQLWNSIATTYGLTQRQPTQL
ncbi:hypothetical protein ABZ920_08790 [Streptomyces sp. NPDC046831]|uniref:hypothetical protein n=1 Tax=Streptomyces sp. NPDC046831 TaxID=3154805 RepID=UPI00340D9D10